MGNHLRVLVLTHYVLCIASPAVTIAYSSTRVHQESVDKFLDVRYFFYGLRRPPRGRESGRLRPGQFLETVSPHPLHCYRVPYKIRSINHSHPAIHLSASIARLAFFCFRLLLTHSGASPSKLPIPMKPRQTGKTRNQQ